MKYPSVVELLKILAETEFRPFDSVDWWNFGGCETNDPMIGYYKPSELTIVIDGDQINVVNEADEYGGKLYKLNELA